MESRPYRAQELCDAILNDGQLWSQIKSALEKGTERAFAAYAGVVTQMALRYRKAGWGTFTLEEMAEAVRLLHEYFTEES